MNEPEPEATPTPQPITISRKKKVLFAVIATVAFFGLLEVGARLVVPPAQADVHREHEKVIEVLGLPSINPTMIPHPYLFWSLQPNLDEFEVTGNIRDSRIDFKITTNSRGLRGGPIGAKGSRFRVLALGDSCTFGVGVAESETWPARLETLLNAAGDDREYEVINSGVPGYTAFQGRRYLEKYGLDLAPDLVIATFGFNDRDTWGSRSDAETARIMAGTGWEATLRHSRLYLGLEQLLNSYISSSKVESELEASPEKPPNGPTRRRISPREFAEQILEIKRLCDVRDIPLVLVNWPSRVQIQRRIPSMNYQPIVDQISTRAGAPAINLVKPFLAAQGPLYLDHIHGSAEACDITARTISDHLQKLQPFEGAEAFLRAFHKANEATLGAEHPSTLFALCGRAHLYCNQGRYDEAEELLALATSASASSLPEGHWFTGLLLDLRGWVMVRRERFDQAESALLKAHEVFMAALGAEHSYTIQTISRLADLYESWGKPDQAARCRAMLPGG